MPDTVFGVNKLVESAQNCSSFNQYADDEKFEWIFGIQPSKDSADNSVSSKIRNWLTGHSAIIVRRYIATGSTSFSEESSPQETFVDAIISTLDDGSGSQDYYHKLYPVNAKGSNLIDDILDSQSQCRSISDREQLIAICFALVRLGGSVAFCDEVMRAASNEICHHRELYQLDAEEGFYRFILYWNASHLNSNITYYEAKNKILPNFLKELCDTISRNLEALEAAVTVNTCTEAEEEGFAAAINNISVEQNNLKTFWGNLDESICSNIFISTSRQALSCADKIADLKVAQLYDSAASFFDTISPDDLDEAIKIFDSEIAAVKALITMINHYIEIINLGDEIVALSDKVKEYIETLREKPSSANRRPVLNELTKKVKTIIREQGVNHEAPQSADINGRKLLPPMIEPSKALLAKVVDVDNNALARIRISVISNTYDDSLLNDALEQLQSLCKDLQAYSRIINDQRSYYDNCQERLNGVLEKVSEKRDVLDRLLKIKCFRDSFADESEQIRNALESQEGIEKAGALYLNASKKAFRRDGEFINSSALQHGTAACCGEVEDLIKEAVENQYDFETVLDSYRQKAARFIGEKDWSAVSIIIKAVNDSERISANKKYFQALKNSSTSSRVTKSEIPDCDEQKRPRLSHVHNPYKFINKSNSKVIQKMMNPRRRDTSLSCGKSISGSDRCPIINGIVSSCDLFNDTDSRLVNGVMTTSRRDLLRFALAVGCDNRTEVKNILGLSGDSNFDSTSGREMLVMMLLTYLEKPNIDREGEKLVSVLEAMRKLEDKAIVYSAEGASEQGINPDRVKKIIAQSTDQLRKIILFPRPSITSEKLYLEFEFCFFAVRKAFERLKSEISETQKQMQKRKETVFKEALNVGILSDQRRPHKIFTAWLNVFEEYTVTLSISSSPKVLTCEFESLNKLIVEFCKNIATFYNNVKGYNDSKNLVGDLEEVKNEIESNLEAAKQIAANLVFFN